MAPRLTYNGMPLIPLEPIQTILEEEIARVPDTQKVGEEIVLTGLQRVTGEIARTTGKTECTIARRLWTIRYGREHSPNGDQAKAGVSFDWADAILRALGREHEWYSNPELNAVYERIGADLEPLEDVA